MFDVPTERLPAGPELDALVSGVLGVAVRPFSSSFECAGELMREHRIGVTPCGYRTKEGSWLATTISAEGKPYFSAHLDPLVAIAHCFLLSKGQAEALNASALI
ncbi:hypothetical protein [Comamonas thiooxydans]|uniref:hypothetical protein n=1 Tax=Comamonas thiooxydans TaxID=363952 RepID=UPI00118574ED|nr:hypothetical protein [Comamonas thiooxydans]